VMRLIRQLNQQHGKTVIFVTHDPRMADFADRTIYLLDGIIHKEVTRAVDVEALRPGPAEYPQGF
jgi:putative ABC transport system ATP-binding protein